MSDPGTVMIYCDTCGAKLPARAPLGLCPKCMLREATFHGEEAREFPGVDEELFDEEIENYRLLRQIGEGGFGIVYEAEQLAPVKRRVALKILKPGMHSRQILARFEAERQALAVLAHPFIARVYDAGETARGLPYFAMELVEGAPLAGFCGENELTLAQRLELFVRICQGVQHAHQKGIIHRDLKPSNILVEGAREKNGERSTTTLRPLPRIIDFGIARATEQLLSEATLLTNAAQVLGTPGYMSPEQAAMNTEAIDTRSDVYALGAILYELLTGTLPFHRTTLKDTPFDEVLRRIREEDPPKPSTRSRPRGQRLPPDLDWITLKALRKDPGERYGSVAELANDVERFLRDEPVIARPPSARYLARKFIARHKTAAATLAVGGLLLLAGAIVSTGLYLRSEENAAEARANAERASESEETKRKTFSRSDFLGSEQLLQLGQPAEAVAQLVRALRTDPGNTAARFKLLATLAYTDFIQPTHPPLEDEFSPFAMALSGDGTRLAVSSETGRVRVRDLESGKTLRVLQHQQWVTAVAFHPHNRDRLLTASRDRTAAVWNLQNGERLFSIEHNGPIQWAAFTPDGERILTHATDGTARVSDTASGKKLATLVHGGTRHGDCWGQVAADGKTVAFTLGPSAQIWSLERYERIGEPLQHDQWIRALAIHGNGLLATGAWDGTARVWDLASGKPLTNPLRHPGGIYTLAFSPDGSRLLTGTLNPDNAARIWDLDLQQAVLPPMRHGERVHQVIFTPDGQRVITAGYTDEPNDAALCVWDAHSAMPVSAPVYLSRGIRLAVFDPERSKLITTSRDGILRQWDLRPRAAHPLILRQPERIWFATFTADSQALAIWTRGRAPELWNPARARRAWGRPLRDACGSPARNLSVGHTALGRHEIHVSEMLPPSFREGLPHSFALSPDGRLLVTGGQDGRIRFWDFAKRKQIRPPVSLGEEIWAIAIAPDNSLIAAATGGSQPESGAVHWFGPDGSPHGSRPGLGSPVYEIAVSAGADAHIATGSLDGTVRVISPGDQREMVHREHAGPVRSLAFSPDGRWLASGSADNTAILWEVATARLHHHLRGHIDRATYGLFVAFSADSRTLATTASHDDTTRLWDVASGEPVCPPMRSDNTVQDLHLSLHHGFVAVGHPVRLLDPRTGSPLMPELETGGHLSSLSVSPDERRVVAGGWNGTAMTWDLPPCDLPLPEWFLQFAEAHGGLRYREDGSREAVDADELDRLRNAVLSRKGNDDLTRWARWLATEPTPEKQASPWMTISRRELADRLATHSTPLSLHHALDLVPDHPLALAMLSWRMASGHPTQTERQEAEFLSRHATRLAPENAEVWKMRSETLRRLGRPQEAERALAEARRIHERNSGLSGFWRRTREWIATLFSKKVAPGR